MRILICGDRNWTDEETMRKFYKPLPPDTVIMQGDCDGADKMAAKLGHEFGFIVETYHAHWELFGKAAGPIRNRTMLKYGNPDTVVAFHNDIKSSKGTKNMLMQARKKGLKTRVITSEMP